MMKRLRTPNIKLRRVLVGIGVGSAIFGVMCWAAVRFLDYLPACDVRCEPGRDCGGFELSLELAEPKARRHRRYDLWYRTTLTNRECRAMRFNAFAFMRSVLQDRNSARQEGLYFKVWGPDGREMKPTPSVSDRIRDEYYPVAPFSVDEAAAKLLWEGGQGEKDSDAYLSLHRDPYEHSLEPGASISPAPHVYDPQPAVWLPGCSDPDEEVKFRRQAGLSMTRNWKPLKTVPGFRVFEDFWFEKRGRYRVQAFFEEKVALSTPRKGLRRRVQFMKALIELGGALLEVPVRPRYDYEVKRVRAASNVVEFDVI